MDHSGQQSGAPEAGDESSWSSQLSSTSTEAVPDEYFKDRRDDFAPFSSRGKHTNPRPEPTNAVQKRKQRLSSGQETEDSMEFEPTQKATQPIRESDISENEASDIICLLYAQTPPAFEALKATMIASPQHLIPNDDLENITEQDFELNPELSLSKNPRSIALRISSKVQVPKKGFTFGRNSDMCDILLVSDAQAKTISNCHFKILVNAQGSLMLEDTSMNGTFVDDFHLIKGKSTSPATRALQNGTLISVVGLEKAEIKFLVTLPKNRGDYQEKYEQNLREYLRARGVTPQFSSMKESTYGNHWDGGKMYNFTGVVGQGAFAMVYKVQTKTLGTVFAAKELDKRRFIKNGMLDIKFDNELKIIRQLNHPNIVRYEDYYEHEQWIYIIMEYVPHGELSKELQARKGPLPESMVQTITRQMLHALDYLHRRNITHRDIKPDNILISSRDPLIVKLADFGLSKSIKNQETFLKTFCGTLLYCAPEIYPDYGTYVRGQAPKRRRPGEAVPRGSPYNQSVDMWSFGAVLFHLLCNKAPIMGRADDRGAQMLNNIMTKSINFDPLRASHVSVEGINFVGQLLNRNPILRPNEQECFRHVWLVRVPDVLNYEHVEVEDIFSQELEVVQEEDEEDLLGDDDLDAYAALYEVADLPPTPRLQLEPARPTKKVRMGTRARPSNEIDDVVVYPTLPATVGDMPPPTSTPARLFGEITPSILQPPAEGVLRSSGLLGEPLPSPNMPQIRTQLAQVSVNDFATMDTGMSPDQSPANFSSEDPIQSPALLGFPRNPGPAPSLYGAEMEIEDLNMASPDAAWVADASDVATPDTTNPVTPREVDPSPASARTKSTEKLDANDADLLFPKLHRKIDLKLLDDEAAFTASMAARQASRAQIAAMRTNIQSQVTSQNPLLTNSMAKTIDAETGKSVSFSDFPNPPRRIDMPAKELPPVDATVNTATTSTDPSPPPELLGTFKTTPESYASIEIPLTERMTSWGRALTCTVGYPDKTDTRIPKHALKIVFWAPGMEEWLAQGNDWRALAGVHTILSTSASRCIWVNGVELKATTPQGDAALYGRIYSGDVVTVWKGESDGTRLEFVVDVRFGGSIEKRPEGEEGFLVRQERRFHQQMLAATKAA